MRIVTSLLVSVELSGLSCSYSPGLVKRESLPRARTIATRGCRSLDNDVATNLDNELNIFLRMPKPSVRR